MFFKGIGFVLLTLFYATSLKSQANQSFTQTGLSALNQSTILIPQQLEGANKGEDRLENVIFYAYPYLSHTVDVRDIKLKYPELEVADSIDIYPPQLAGFTDLTLLMSVLEEPGRESKLVIWIAGNFERNKVTFYIDETLDRDFRNDGKPKIIRSGRTPIGIKIYPYGKDKRFRTLNIAVPKRNNPIDQAVKTIEDFALSNELNHFSIGLQAGFGGGKLNYNFDNLETGFPTWYDVSLSEIRLGVSLNYHVKRLVFGAKGALQTIKQYTSYYNERIDEPAFIVNPNNGRREFRDNVAISTNQDLHSNSRFQFGVLTGYNISLSRNIELQPTVSLGYIFYNSGEYVSNKYLDPQLIYAHKKDRYVEGGMNLLFNTGRFKSLSLGMSYTLINWEPEGFSESFNGENFKQNYSTIGATVGYNIGF